MAVVHLIRCRKYYFFIFLLLTILFIYYCILSNIFPVPVSCRAHSLDVLKREEDFRNQIDSKLEALFANQRSIYGEHIPKETKHWMQVAENIYLYSAYYDVCDSTLFVSSSLCIKFIGMTLSGDNNEDALRSYIKCAFKYENSIIKKGFTVIKKLPESHDKLFTAAFFYCSLKNVTFPNNSVPKQAALFLTASEIKWHQVHLLTHDWSSKKGKINLCVRPFYDFQPVVLLAEFLAYYSNMGVDHFIFYHHKSVKSWNKIQGFLTSTNISMEIMLWDIPLNNEYIHEYGQIIFTQDCIYYSKNKFSHTIIVDVDEYIVPKQHSNLSALLSHLDAVHLDAGSYVFPMVLFCKEYAIENPVWPPFQILMHNKRQKTAWQYPDRSKYIARPERVEYGGVHFVWKHHFNMFQVEIQEKVAFIHHYRQCCGMQQTWFLYLFSFYVLSDRILKDDSLIRQGRILNHSLTNWIQTTFLSEIQ